MFTGLIEEIGIVKNIKPLGKGREIIISSKVINKELQLGDSVNVNGVCQTVETFDSNSFKVTAVEETLKKTNLGSLKVNDKVNLESSLTMSKKLGGHFVLGHIDTTGTISKIEKLTASWNLTVKYPKEYSKYLIHVGSIAVDGVSLTVAENSDSDFSVAVIPHTWDNTIFHFKKSGDSVNLEFDVLGKYVDNILNGSNKSTFTIERLKDLGY
ncbi:MAG: riboflavin synthase [Ignavibacteriae bacterium]|jgi:riboflavin synthase|nr:riboflavin synthase [Ignavibacteriota bacterium]